MTAPGSGVMPTFDSVDDVLTWLDEQRRSRAMTARQVPLDALDSWRLDPRTGNLHHDSGRFFSVEGIRVNDPSGPVPEWDQPIIHQPEVGILGILVDRRGGAQDRYLMQAKCEPGNPGGVQISPTVQATRSNYTRVHRGSAVPYLEHFRGVDPARVVADVRQSEQGAWFYRKRNRNMIVEADADVERRDGFCWLSLPVLHHLLAEPDLVNMDARTVLACLPAGTVGRAPASGRVGAAVRDTLDAGDADPRVHAGSLSWITEQRTENELDARLVPLRDARRWRFEDGMIRHESGGYFTILGVEVTARGREVRSWHQPMLAPTGNGVVGVLVTRESDGLHVLMRSRTEPGCTDGSELGPTVQCQPDTLESDPIRPRPPFLDRFLDPAPGTIRFDAVQSEEGGRFFHARNRYMVVEVPDRLPSPPGYRWFGLDELTDVMRHSFYLNVQARSVLLCLTSLVTVGV